MKKTILFISIFSSLLAFGQTPANDPHWELDWEDNFNSTTIDPSKWTIVDWAHGNIECLMLAQNVKQENGLLKITVNNNEVYCPQNPITVWGASTPCHNQWYNYNSGWIETTQAYNTQYGYIEARIKLPYGYGFFPAFWTFIGFGAANGSNAAEIDIFEMLGGHPDPTHPFNTPNILTTNYHHDYEGSGRPMEKHTPVGFDYTQWHTYAVEWSPSKIIWYVDGIPIRISPSHGIVDPVRIILSFSVQTDADRKPNTSTPFPSEMLVDYVKVYKLRNDCNTSLTLCNINPFTFALYDNKVKKNITIGNGSCTNTLDVGNNVFLRASEGVLINGDFTVPLGAQLYIDVNPCH